MNIREETKHFIEKYGSKKSWLAKRISVSSTHFGEFLKGERQLAGHRIEKLKEIISK